MVDRGEVDDHIERFAREGQRAHVTNLKFDTVAIRGEAPLCAPDHPGIEIYSYDFCIGELPQDQLDSDALAATNFEHASHSRQLGRLQDSRSDRLPQLADAQRAVDEE